MIRQQRADPGGTATSGAVAAMVASTRTLFRKGDSVPRELNKYEREFIDAGKRASDILNTYVHGMPWEDVRNKFLAIRLSDGGSDGVLYDSKRDAIRHQAHENLCAYVCLRDIGPAGSNPRDMAIFLSVNRKAYDAGFRLTDPDDANGGRSILITAQMGDVLKQKVTPLFLADALGSRAILEELKRGLPGYV